jgi:translocation protein SEC62
LALSGMMEKQQTVINATEPNDSFAGSPEEAASPSSKVEETYSEQYEAEVIENVEDAEQHKNDDHI